MVFKSVFKFYHPCVYTLVGLFTESEKTKWQIYKHTGGKTENGTVWPKILTHYKTKQTFNYGAIIIIDFYFMKLPAL